MLGSGAGSMMDLGASVTHFLVALLVCTLMCSLSALDSPNLLKKQGAKRLSKGACGPKSDISHAQCH